MSNMVGLAGPWAPVIMQGNEDVDAEYNYRLTLEKEVALTRSVDFGLCSLSIRKETAIPIVL